MSEKRKAYSKAYYQEHSEEIKKKAKAYRESKSNEIKLRKEAYRESHSDEIKAYRETHSDEIKEHDKAYRESHSDEIKAYRESHSDESKAYRETHSDEIKEYHKEYHKIKRERKTSNLNLSLDLGSMNKQCEFCNAMLFDKEFSSFCCDNGEISLYTLLDPPYPLRDLLDYNSKVFSNHDRNLFKENIRQYNSSLALASCGVHETVIPGHGPPTFKVNGIISHRIGSITNDDNSKYNPQFLQLYFIGDLSMQAESRKSFFINLETNLLRQLQDMLYNHNAILKNILFICEQNENIDNYTIRITEPSKDLDQRTYNIPSVTNVIIGFVPDNNDIYKRDILIKYKGGSLQHISEMNR